MLNQYLKYDLQGYSQSEIASLINITPNALQIWLNENHLLVKAKLPAAAKEMIQILKMEIEDLSVDIKKTLEQIEKDKALEAELKIKNNHQEKEIEQLTAEILKRNAKSIIIHSNNFRQKGLAR